MEKDFEEFISIRCEKALTECEEFIQKEYANTCNQEELQVLAEKLCYEKGFRDCLAIIMYSQKI